MTNWTIDAHGVTLPPAVRLVFARQIAQEPATVAAILNELDLDAGVLQIGTPKCYASTADELGMEVAFLPENARALRDILLREGHARERGQAEVTLRREKNHRILRSPDADIPSHIPDTPAEASRRERLIGDIDAALEEKLARAPVWMFTGDLIPWFDESTATRILGTRVNVHIILIVGSTSVEAILRRLMLGGTNPTVRPVILTDLPALPVDLVRDLTRRAVPTLCIAEQVDALAKRHLPKLVGVPPLPNDGGTTAVRRATKHAA